MVSHLSVFSSPPILLTSIQQPWAILGGKHIVVTYDVKFEEGKGLPPERHMGPFRYPGNADVFFRKRQG